MQTKFAHHIKFIILKIKFVSSLIRLTWKRNNIYVDLPNKIVLKTIRPKLGYVTHYKAEGVSYYQMNLPQQQIIELSEECRLIFAKTICAIRDSGDVTGDSEPTEMQ